ncbi:acetyl-CoA hydrolase/transferase family protein [Azohydromonas australica]|uniref:acetyl-CoA hydrolase/transferase family protein n=1 Tax=Azohydromonas australica TaxID=364039 RepID=UPI000418282D|nr:acetyl-CoA hydrolase/transferase C-terminal domain-containing protein [Azohydromonas australica]
MKTNTLPTLAPDISRFVNPGDTVIWGQSHAEPLSLIRALVAQRERLAGVRIFLGTGTHGALSGDGSGAFELTSWCGTGSHRALADAGRLQILPVHHSHLPRLIQQGPLQAQAVMLQVSPPDALGRYSLGMARGYLVDAVSTARTILAEVHPDVPWTYGGPYLYEADFDMLVPSEDPLPQARAAALDPVAWTIGRHVAGLIVDGATLQVGTGAIAEAVLAQLTDRRELGVHADCIGEGYVPLHEAGVITNSHKGINVGASIAGALVGDERLRRFAHRNRALELRGPEYTHNAQVLARLERFVSVHGAFEVDLTGQVNAEVDDGRYVGGIGGSVDFVRGAQASRGGIPVIALPSVASTRSRIVPSLAGPVTVSRSDACVIVTEHGVADLRGLSLEKRIRRMIAIADPQHRDALEQAAHGLLRRG